MYSSLSGPFHSNCWVDSECHQYSATALYCIMLMVLQNDSRQIITTWSKGKTRKGPKEALGRLNGVTYMWGGKGDGSTAVNIVICMAVAVAFKKLLHPICCPQKIWFSVCVNICLSWACEQDHWSQVTTHFNKKPLLWTSRSWPLTVTSLEVEKEYASSNFRYKA